MTVRVSADSASSWDDGMLIEPGYSGYSSLVSEPLALGGGCATRRRLRRERRRERRLKGALFGRAGRRRRVLHDGLEGAEGRAEGGCGGLLFEAPSGIVFVRFPLADGALGVDVQ